MAIKAFELTAIDAKRFSKRDERPQNIRIDHNSTVTLIAASGDDTANVDFRFTANFVGVGVIKIEGRLTWEGQATALAEQWQRSNNMPPEVAGQIHAAVLANCLPSAVLIARDLGLPPPLPPIPQLTPGGPSRPGGGKETRGPEVA